MFNGFHSFGFIRDSTRIDLDPLLSFRKSPTPFEPYPSNGREPSIQKIVYHSRVDVTLYYIHYAFLFVSVLYVFLRVTTT